MNHKRYILISMTVFTVLLATLACATSTTGSNDDTTGSTSGTTRQWASSADASSAFGSSDWAATQATGSPNTLTCGDEVTAWASSSYSGVDWLDVGFTTPVVPTQINIYESYTPGSIVKVEVRDLDGSFHTVYQGTPASVSDCPRVLTININDIDYKVNAVLISVDQSELNNWDEIDAVELVGTP